MSSACVNAPLFATFLLGMFWKRTTAHGAFAGLIARHLSRALLISCSTIAEGKGGWIANLHTFPSQMAQNFWIAIVAFTTCFLVISVAVSMVTTPRPDKEMEGLVYGLTKSSRMTRAPSGISGPAPLAVIVLVLLDYPEHLVSLIWT